MSDRWCQKCEKWLPIGIHTCVPTSKAAKPAAVPSPKRAPKAPSSNALPHVTSRALPHPLPHSAERARKGGAKRQAKWRAAHLDAWRAYHRSYMKRWRSKRRALPSPQRTRTDGHKETSARR